MITLLIGLIDCYLRAFGHEPFIKNIDAMSVAMIFEVLTIDILIICLVGWRTTK